MASSNESTSEEIVKIISAKEFEKLLDYDKFDIKKLINDNHWRLLLTDCNDTAILKHVVDHCNTTDLVTHTNVISWSKRPIYYYNALNIACRYTKNEDFLRYLIDIYNKNGYDFNKILGDGPIIINSLFQYQHIELGAYLLSICHMNSDNPTLRVDNIQASKNLLEQQDRNGDRIIHEACQYYQPEVIDYLISLGVELNCPNDLGYYPIHKLCDRYFFRSRYDKARSVIVATDERYSDEEKLSFVNTLDNLIRHGADITKTTKYGATPLHTAVERSNLLFIKCLVSHGANCSALDSINMTPIMLAIFNQTDDEIIAYLLDYSSFDDVSRHGWNLFDYICHFGSHNIILYALNHKNFRVSEVSKTKQQLGFMIESRRNPYPLSPEHKQIILNALKQKGLYTEESSCVIL